MRPACMSACSTIIFSKQCCATPIPQNFAGEGRGVLFKLQVHQFDPWGVLGGSSSSSASCSLGSRVVLDASRCSGEMLYILWCNVYTFNRKMTSCSLAAIGLISRSTTPQVFFLWSKERIPHLGQKPGTSVADTKIASIAGHRKWSNGYWLMPIFVCSSPRAHLCNLCTSFFLFHFFLSLHILADGGEVRLGGTTQDDSGH